MKRNLISSALTVVLGIATASTAMAAEKRSYCVWDPLGAAGPAFNEMREVKTKALGLGFELELKAYTDEAIAGNDFRAGQCDAVLLTDIRARDFNKFTATLIAVGAIPTETELKTVLQTLAQPKAAELMVQGEYEVAGIMPAGSILVYTRDRKIHNVATIQGKKMAALDYDPAFMTMVQRVGASPVPANTTNFAGKFNNGSVDVAAGPALAYKPMELYKGVEPDGGVFSYPFAQLSFQMIVKRDRFTPEFTQGMRNHFIGNFDKYMKQVKVAEADIPQQYWMHPTAEDAAGFDTMLKKVRVELREQGLYDPRALNLMLKVRCKSNPTRAECASPTE